MCVLLHTHTHTHTHMDAYRPYTFSPSHPYPPPAHRHPSSYAPSYSSSHSPSHSPPLPCPSSTFLHIHHFLLLILFSPNTLGCLLPSSSYPPPAHTHTHTRTHTLLLTPHPRRTILLAPPSANHPACSASTRAERSLNAALMIAKYRYMGMRC